MGGHMGEKDANATSSGSSRRNRFEQLRPIGSFFREHPAIAVTLLYFQVTTVGVVYSWALFRRFDINVFDYAEANDFLLAAFKDPLVFLMSMLTIILIVATQVLAIVFRRWQVKRRPRPEVTTSDTSSKWAFLDSNLSESATAMVFWSLLVLFPFVVVSYSLIPPVVLANRTANSLLGPTDEPLTSVQYRATSGSDEQTTEKGLRVIGTTQNFVFFYDRKETRTLIIPNAQIVEMEHAVENP
jgi:hypothetical protein